MLTGYTAKVKSGEVKDLKDFALDCSRAFEAMIHMRHKSLDSEFTKPEPSNYHLESRNKAIKELNEFNKKSNSEILKEIEKLNKKDIESYNKVIKKNKESENNYRDMLKKVKNWTPPTEDHIELKKFMIDELEKSIQFGCESEEYYTNEINKIKQISVEQYIENKIESITKNINYHTKKYNEEVKIVAKRVKWIDDLLESL